MTLDEVTRSRNNSDDNVMLISSEFHGGRWAQSARVRLTVFSAPPQRRYTLMRGIGVRFRNEMESGPGGRQVQIEDPDANPIELFEPGGK